MLAGRGYFEEAVRWLEIHGGVEGQELAAHWRSLDLGDVAPPASLARGEPASGGTAPVGGDRPRGRGSSRRRRRRRRPPAAPA